MGSYLHVCILYNDILIAMQGKFDNLSCNPTSIISCSLFVDYIFIVPAGTNLQGLGTSPVT